MKKLIFILTLFLSLCCQAQNPLFFGQNQNIVTENEIVFTQGASPSLRILGNAIGYTNVDWGDGNSDLLFGSYDITHNYSIEEPHTISIDAFQTNRFRIDENQNITSVDFSKAVSLDTLTVQRNINITSLDLSSNVNLLLLLADRIGVTSLDLSNNSKLIRTQVGANNIITSITFGSHPNMEVLSVGFVAQNLTSLDVTTMTSLEALEFRFTGLTTIDISNNPNITNISGDNSKLTTSAINDILINLDNSGVINGFANLDGQTPSAPPSGAGITAKNNLIGKGWTVTTD